jgi:HK97 family phage prohead protease
MTTSSPNLIDPRYERREHGGTILQASSTLTGYAAVFNSLSVDLGNFHERVLPGAFTETIHQDDIRALWNGNPNYVLGRKKNGTLRLSEDSKGLAVEIKLPDTILGKAIIELVHRGDVDQMAFGFATLKEQWIREEGKRIRELQKLKLFEVGPATFPIYPQTNLAVAQRSLKRHVGMESFRMRLDEHERKIRLDELREELRLMVRHAYVSSLHMPLQAARVTAALAAVDLEIPCPKVELGSIEEARRRTATGWIQRGSNIIYVRPFLCSCESALVGAHESRHLYQFRWGTLSQESDEIDARNYEWTFSQCYLGAGLRCGECNRLIAS